MRGAPRGPGLAPRPPISLILGSTVFALPFLAAVLAAPAAAAGPEVTVLLHHPDDGVDPLGFAYSASGDYFTTRYAALAADKGRFDFPYFVADGVVPIEKIPDPSRPFESARQAYEAAAASRLAGQPPATLHLASVATGAQAVVTVRVEPRTDLAGEDLHLMLALTEDPVHYQPPPGLTNGVTEHRFTVRAVHDAGRIAGTDAAAPSNASHTFPLADGWQRDRLHVAAWLQQGSGSPRFDAREVVQATGAPLGDAVVQDTKGALVEMYSATWCEPCLYGDLAAEAVAVAHGSASPLLADDGPRYFQAPAAPILAIAAAAVAGVAAAWWGGRR